MLKKSSVLIVGSVMITTLLVNVLSPTAAQDCDPSVNYFSLGNTTYDAGDYAGALANYQCAVQLDAESAAAYNGRGNANRQLENYEAAIADYNQAIAFNASIAVFYNNRGWTYYKLGNLEAALLDFNKAIALDSMLAYAYNNRGLVYAKLGNYEAAAADYAHVLELGEEVSAEWANFNLTNLPGGFTALATEAAATEIPSSQADRVQAFIDEGNSAFDIGDYESALAAYTNAIELDPRNGEWYALRGSAQYRVHDNDATIADYDRAIELGFSEAYAFYNRGLAYYNQGNLEAAFSDYNRAIQADSTYEYAYGARGTIYMEQGEYEKALADFDKALELGSDNRLTTLERAVLLNLMGETAEAFRVYQDWLDTQFEVIDQIPLAPGETATAQMNEGIVYRIPFNAEKGQTLHIEARSTSDVVVDPLIIILNPNNVPVEIADDTGESLDATIPEFTAKDNGEYTLIITHAYGGSVGLVEISLQVAE